MIQNIVEKHHFTLKNSTTIPEMQGTLWEMEHDKSGAKLVWLDRPDENMTFGVGFRTIPTDSTGVFHILEHSVLNGSEKYPVKEPFVELLKSSLQTFLNAMTFPDKTVYPFSSRNHQDFRNLLGIYMDAVLHPNAVRNPNTFRQEGWRLEFAEDGTPMFQGVVYNEMKGAFSSVNTVLEDSMLQNLFPDSCYRHESGGDPVHIPELTYAQFVSEHAKYYHPSNSLMVLDGQVELDECLALLDGCLAEYDRQTMEFPIPMQEPLPFRQEEIPYEIGEEEDPADKTIVSFGKLLCSYDDPVTLHGAGLLADYLTGGSEAPLKRAILDAGLGANMSVELHDGMQQAWFGWEVWNTCADNVSRIREVIRTTLEDILAKGLDRERLQGCFHSMAFKLLDRDNHGYPRGLLECLNILEPWLYGGNPAQNLSYRPILDRLKARMDEGFLEDLIRRYLLDESDGFLAVLVPSRTLGRERVEQEQQRARDYWDGLGEAEKQALLSDLDTLHVWQQTPDSAEALATIPLLTLDDVRAEPAPLNCTKETRGTTTVLRHGTAGELVYIDLLFDASDLSAEDMPMLNLLSSLLGTLGTARRSGSELQTAIRQKIGSLHFSPDVLHRDPDHHSTWFCARSVCLRDHISDTADLLTEILNETRFTDLDMVRNILKQKKTANQQWLISRGNSFAASRVLARQTSAGMARELMTGCENIRWVAARCDSSEEELRNRMAHMEQLCRTIFNRDRLIISISENAEPLVDRLMNAFPAGEAPKDCASFPVMEPCREGILIPAGVGYAAKCVNLGRFDRHFHGQLYVLSNLLTFEHLWNEVRVKGGAYGTEFRGSTSDDLIATSFRDPSPVRTLEHFDACADVVEQFCDTHDDVTKYILGAMSDADPLLGDAGKVRLGEARHLKGTDQETVSRIRREMLSTTAEDLRGYCDALRTMADAQNYCIVGGREHLDAFGEKLDRIIDILS